MIEKIEIYSKQVITGQKKGLFAWIAKTILYFFSFFYRGITNSRNYLYDRGWMRCYTPPVSLVISIGNIVAGGTGKTPVTLLLAEAFYEKYTLAILSRGYRSKVEKLAMPILLCEGQGPIFPASYCGDEPYLFAQRFPTSLVIVGGDRRKASFLAAKAGAQVILLDDGMQHRRLTRDFDVVVIDARDPFGQGYFLPRGFLREDCSALSRAHLIVINHIIDNENFISLKERLKKFTKAAMIGTKAEIVALRDLKNQNHAIVPHTLIGMFCAIAHPNYFRQTLENQGYEIVEEYILPDHEEISEKKLAQFALTCLKKGACYLICTEKDRVKLNDQLITAIQILWIKQELKIIAGQQEWQTFLNQALAKII